MVYRRQNLASTLPQRLLLDQEQPFPGFKLRKPDLDAFFGPIKPKENE